MANADKIQTGVKCLSGDSRDDCDVVHNLILQKFSTPRTFAA